MVWRGGLVSGGFLVLLPFSSSPLMYCKMGYLNLLVDRVMVIVCHCKRSRELVRPVGLPQDGVDIRTWSPRRW